MSRMSKRSVSGVTLIELILALVLVGVVIMTGLSMELGMRRVHSSTDVEAQLLMEAAPIISMIARDINRGIGCLACGSFPVAYSFSATNNIIYYDSNGNHQRDAADLGANYRYTSGTGTLDYNNNYPGGSYLVLSNKVAGFSIAAPVNGVSVITLQLRNNPAQAASGVNPEILVTSGAQFRECSIS